MDLFAFLENDAKVIKPGRAAAPVRGQGRGLTPVMARAAPCATFAHTKHTPIMAKEILIIGSGCARCQDTFEFVKSVVENEANDVRVNHQFGPEEKTKHKLEATPGIFVDGKLKMQGRVPTVEEIRALMG